MLSISSRSRWVPTMRTSWPLSVSGVARAVAMIPAPRTAIVVIAAASLARSGTRRRARSGSHTGDHPWRVGQAGDHGVRLAELLDGRCGRCLAAQQPDRAHAEALGRADVAVEPVADVDGPAGIDAGLVQGVLPDARVRLHRPGRLGQPEQVEVVDQTVPAQRLEHALVLVGDQAELV